jgi:signal transduction histidine kinase
MPDFDVRTAFLIIGVLYLLLPIITWVVLIEQRSPQVVLWCGGGLLVGIGFILIGLRGILPELATYPIANSLIVVSHFARIQALRLDIGKPWRLRWMLMAGGSLCLIFFWMKLGDFSGSLRGQFNSVVTAGFVFYIAMLAWRIGRDEGSRSAQWIAWVYGMVVVAFLFRLYVLLNSDTGGDVLIEGFSTQLIAMTVLLSSVVGHLGYVGLKLDRSMRRELKAAAEKARDEEGRRLGEQIAQLDRQRSLGEMSASLGHELNQPLTAILTNAQVAKRGLLAGRFQAEQFGEFLDKIIQNTQRASQIIERIRGFIRPTVARCEPVDLNRTVHEVAELVAAEVRSHQVKLVFAGQASPILVAGDPIQLSQIVMNVLRNAIEALQQVAHREIRIASTRADGRVILQIRDSGPGLAAEVLAQVGSPFFTTKPSGLGMGISISRSIAQQHGGTLSIANADQGGAVVELNLPALPEGSS